MTRNIKTAPTPKVRNIVAKLGRGGLSREERRAALDKAVRKLFSAKGITALTRDKVSAEAKCTAGMVNNHYGTADDMRAWALDDAVARKDVKALKRHAKEGNPLPKMPRALKAEIVAA